jgi:uncharacterized delta-60 repeat protein
MILQPDGKILVNGFFDNGTDDDCFVARFESDGGLDNSFGTNGIVKLNVGGDNNYCNDIALQSDDKIIVAGHYNVGPNQDIYLARLDTDGSLDNSFDSDGLVTTWVSATDDNAHGVAVQADGKIVLTGFTGAFGNEDILVMRYLDDGSLDTSFDTDGIVTTAIGGTSFSST